MRLPCFVLMGERLKEYVPCFFDKGFHLQVHPAKRI